MKILYIAPNIKIPGHKGGATHVREVVEHLSLNNEIKVIVRIGSKGKNFIPIGPCSLGYPVLKQISPYFLFVPSFLSLKKSSFVPDVIYERSSAMGLGVILSKYYRCPMITEVNDNIYHRLSLIHARKIITTFRGLIPREYHQKVIELSWGANHKRFNPEIDGKAIKRRYHIENKFIIGYAGGFYNYHGLMDTVQVARGFTNDSSIRFMLVGSGDESKKIASLINKYKLNEQFILTGKIPYEEIPAYIASFDICIAPYNPYKHKALKNYGFYFNPLKIFEYLAMKKPVITTKLGNISKLFKHREHLYMIESGNIAELKDAIRELIYDSSLRNKLANCGYNYFIKNFTWKAHCEYLEKIFKETISGY